jgi:hypothetical protein
MVGFACRSFCKKQRLAKIHAMTRIGLLSDTHGHCDDRMLHHLQKCDEIWHAGDVGDPLVLEQLEQVAPVKGVHGNIDGTDVRKTLPTNLRFKCEEVEVWITHIGGRAHRYDRFVRDELLKDAPDLFICGHSHILKVEFDKKLQMLYMNPGAAGRHGFHIMRTMLRFQIEGKNIGNLEVVELGQRSSLA